MSDSAPPLQREGNACFHVADAFYRPKTKLVRDLGVLAAIVHRHSLGQLRVLDAMAGCGVRSLRYALEAGVDSLWVNDSNPDLHDVLASNLSRSLSGDRYRLTHEDANRIFFACHLQRSYYDLVDIDCFGSAAPFLSTGLWAVTLGGLLYITSTDGRTIAGRPAQSGLAAYGAYPRPHPAVHEQGLRLLIGSLQQQAAHKGMGIQPIFSLWTGQTCRVMVRLVPKTGLNSENYGFLGYCHHCGNYQTVNWRFLSQAACPVDQTSLVLTGPQWLGPLHCGDFLAKMQQQAEQRQWINVVSLLQVMQEESNFPPYFYPLGEIGRRGKMDIPQRSHLISALLREGYRASATHLSAQAIKTDADLQTCINLARSLS